LALILSAALLVVAVVAYVISPIIQRRHAPLSTEGDDLTDALSRKRVALMALRDAEYDFATGKVDQQDYDALRLELSAQALNAVKDADGLESQEAESTTPDASDEAVEAEIARVRAGLANGVACAPCGQLNRQGSHFCTSCGRPLGQSAPALG
jgi:hypothetical protein